MQLLANYFGQMWKIKVLLLQTKLKMKGTKVPSVKLVPLLVVISISLLENRGLCSAGRLLQHAGGWLWFERSKEGGIGD